jgi:Ni,Fe-hydrogenase I small subunit
MRRSVFAAGACAILLAGCNATTVSVPANGSAVVSQMGMFQLHACTAWEPPAGRVTQPPRNGQAVVTTSQGVINTPGHPCQGKPISGTIVRYTPRPGFAGTDQLTVDYDYIETDGGRRASRSETVTIQVR